ncbi:MAG: MBL fold metallo-hydrolase [Chloroflexi bacterium]|nr:MBL fold metallo-hydrolase [Chloroflexota bacterium]
MSYRRIFMEQLLEHLYVIGQERIDPQALSTDCHVYIIVGERGALAVDAGGGHLWPYVRAVAEANAFADKIISHVLLTHGHGDHARGLPDFERQGALTVSSVYTAEHLDSEEDADLLFERDEVLELGEFRPQAILTPGHTPGSASYLLTIDGQVCLFTGDLVQTDGGLGWCGDKGFNQEQVLQSLKKLAALKPPIDLMLAGHGVVRDPQALLARAIALGEAGKWIVWTDKRPDLSQV